MRTSRGRIRLIAARALASLPAEVRERLDNIAIAVEELPTRADRAAGGHRPRPRALVLGIYRGWPLAARGDGYHLALPDHIAIFRRPLLAYCRSQRQLTCEIGRTLLHEVGHHFGLDDATLERLEAQTG